MRDLVHRQNHLAPVRNGFSLVEMMVVLFIMGLAATVVVMTIPGDERKLRDEAERLAARTLAARDDAIVGAHPVSLVMDARGYHFEGRVEGQWQPLAGAGFGTIQWSDGILVDARKQRIVFDSLGLASSEAQVRLTRKGATVTIHLQRDGKMTVNGT